MKFRFVIAATAALLAELFGPAFSSVPTGQAAPAPAHYVQTAGGQH